MNTIEFIFIVHRGDTKNNNMRNRQAVIETIKKTRSLYTLKTVRRLQSHQSLCGVKNMLYNMVNMSSCIVEKIIIIICLKGDIGVYF